MVSIILVCNCCLEQDGSEIKNSDYEAKLAQIRQVYQTEYGKYEQVQKTKWVISSHGQLLFLAIVWLWFSLTRQGEGPIILY